MDDKAKHESYWDGEQVQKTAERSRQLKGEIHTLGIARVFGEWIRDGKHRVPKSIQGAPSLAQRGSSGVVNLGRRAGDKW